MIKKEKKLDDFLRSANKLKLEDAEIKKVLEFFPNGIIAIDLETTGLSPLVDKIIEVALYKITKDGAFVFETLINPEILIPEHTILIHQITDEMVKNAPKIEEVLPSIIDFIDDLPIVAHNAKFDIGFIVMAIKKFHAKMPKSKIYCSCKLSRNTFKDFKSHKLSNLVRELEIPLENHHRALDDTFASLKIFIKSLDKIKKDSKHDLGILFSLNEFDSFNHEEIPNHLNELSSLVQSASVIEIMYSGGNFKNQFRPIKLTSLLNTPDGNILYAKCLLSNLYKSFKINKIKSLRHPSADDISKWLKNNEARR